MAIKTHSPIFEKNLFQVQSPSYQTIEGFDIPVLTSEQVESCFDKFVKGYQILVKDSINHYSLPLTQVSNISGKSITVLLTPELAVAYTISGSTVVTKVTQIGGLETFVFKGFISTTAPASANEGELWYNSTTKPTTFPVSVKRYVNGSWSSDTESYTAKALDMWSDRNDTPSTGWFWFGGAWQKIDFDAVTDEVTMTKNAQGRLEMKDKGHDATKMADVTIGTGLVKSTDGKTINHKDSVTAGTHSPIVVTNSSATGTEGGSFKSKKFNFNDTGHKNSADSDDVTVGLERGLRMYGGKIGHTNGITAQTSGIGSSTQYISSLKFDSHGHITGVGTGTMYPPTTAGTSGQFWKSDGSGVGVWGTSGTITTSGLTFSAYSGVTMNSGYPKYYVVETDWGYIYDISIYFSTTLGVQTAEKALFSISGLKGTQKVSYDALSPLYKSNLGVYHRPTGLLYNGAVIYLDSIPIANIGGFLQFHFIRKK